MCRSTCATDHRDTGGSASRGRNTARLAALPPVRPTALPVALVAVLLAGTGLALTAAAPAQHTAVAVEIDARPVGLLPMTAGDRLGISFIHSVDRLPVEDWYVLRDGHLVQDSTRLVEFGAGMGHIAGQGRGRADGDWWEVSGLDRHIGTLVLRIGPPSVEHRLLYRDREVNLSACWPGQRLTLRPVRTASAPPATGQLPVPGHGCGR
jgi:hypothetical protein